jgi:hypothetical protein
MRTWDTFSTTDPGRHTSDTVSTQHRLNGKTSRSETATYDYRPRADGGSAVGSALAAAWPRNWRRGCAQAVITFFRPLCMISAQEQHARSQQPARHQPPAGSHNLQFHFPIAAAQAGQPHSRSHSGQQPTPRARQAKRRPQFAGGYRTAANPERPPSSSLFRYVS